MIQIARSLPREFNLNRLRKFFETKSGYIFPEFSLFVPKHQNILAVLDGPNGRMLMPASNIVTSAGDIFYAQKSTGTTPTNAFGTHVMCSAGTPGKAATYASFTPIASASAANDGTYPMVSDTDSDNTGGGAAVITHRASFSKVSFAAASISHGIITVPTPTGSVALLTGYAFAAAFSKTVDDTLKVFVNHALLGV